MYDFRPNTIIGFHGCDQDVRNRLVNDPNKIEISKKSFEWLGHGMYFWENNYVRAQEWADNKHKQGSIKQPSVLGAIIQLDYCCDFLDSKFIRLFRAYYEIMAQNYASAGQKLPRNIDAADDPHQNKLIRKLDCATLEFMHDTILKERNADIARDGFSNRSVFDTVRGVFIEGGPVYKGAGIFEKSHIQVCVRNVNCIKGFFIPREEVEFP